jgi:hypothetical protein
MTMAGKMPPDIPKKKGKGTAAKKAVAAKKTTTSQKGAAKAVPKKGTGQSGY